MNTQSRTSVNNPANAFTSFDVGAQYDKTAAETDAVDAMYQYIDMQQLLNAFYLKLKISYQIDRVEVWLPRTTFYSGLSRPGMDSFKLGYQIECRAVERDRKTHPKVFLYRRYQFQNSELAQLKVFIRRFSGPFKNAVSHDNACHAASHDCLTDLYNRNSFDQYLSHSSSTDKYQGLIVCDVDNFKAINDQYSHLVGDSVLRQFAGILRTVSSSKSLVFRYGGDEFVIVHGDSCRDSARQMANRIRSTVENTPFTTGSRSLNLTTTIGVSDIHQGESIQIAFLRADRALVRGKMNGRNQVYLADTVV